MFNKNKKDDLDLPPLPPSLSEDYSAATPDLSNQVSNIEKSQLNTGNPIPQQSQNQQPLAEMPKAPIPSSPTAVAPIPSIAPAPPQNSQNEIEMFTEDLEKIADAIIEEKMDKIKEKIDEVNSMKDKLSSQINSLSANVNAMNERLNNMENAVLSKVKDYNQNIKNVKIELEAVGKVFEKLIPEFTTNVKDLREIVQTKKSASVLPSSKTKKKRGRGRPPKNK